MVALSIIKIIIVKGGGTDSTDKDWHQPTARTESNGSHMLLTPFTSIHRNLSYFMHDQIGNIFKQKGKDIIMQFIMQIIYK